MSVQTIYASASRTSTPTAVTINRRRAKAVDVVIDATAITATPSVVCTVDGYDSTSNTWFNLITSAAVTNTSSRVLEVGPGLTAATNLVVNKYLPDTLRVVMTHGDADAITYTVAAHLIR
jgi:hypothetical protein